MKAGIGEQGWGPGLGCRAGARGGVQGCGPESGSRVWAGAWGSRVWAGGCRAVAGVEEQ